MKPPTEKPRFLADQMLGRLAKWLRILGFNTKYFNKIDSSDLLRIAKHENRVLLTRNTQLVKTRPVVRNQISAILIDNDHLDSQLLQLMSKLDIEKIRFSTSYCPNCNVLIKKVPKKTVRGRVPSYVYKTQEEFAFCSKCSSFFWKGTHWDRITEKLQGILNVNAG